MKQFKMTIIFKEIGKKNKVKIVSKKLSERTMNRLTTYLLPELFIEEPMRQLIDELTAEINRVDGELKDNDVK